MFEKNKKKALGKSIQDFESILGKSIRVDGNLIIAQSVRIDGNLNGNILQEDGTKATIAIAPSARIVGDIRADHIIVAGSIKGNIFSTGKIELLANAQIEGDITYGEVGIEVGAKVAGKLLQINATSSGDETQALLAQVQQKIAS